MRFDASPAPLTELAAEDLIRFFQGFDLHAKSVTFLREEDVSARWPPTRSSCRSSSEMPPSSLRPCCPGLHHLPLLLSVMSQLLL